MSVTEILPSSYPPANDDPADNQVPIRHATHSVYQLYKQKPSSIHGSMEVNGVRMKGFVHGGLFFTVVVDELGANCYVLNKTFEEQEEAA